MSAAKRSEQMGPADVDIPQLLDPEIAAALAAFPLDLGQLSDETLAAIRQGMGAAPAPELSGAVERADHRVPGAPGDPDVSLRVHRRPGLEGPAPAVVWIHGGGYVLGSNEGDDLRFDRWCRRFPIVGVSVDYRLSPETPFPGPLDDCYAALRWTFEHAEELGVDRSRIGIGGQSAGAGLAAGLALLARDRGEIPLAFQLLIYPMIDDRMVTPSSAWVDPVWPPAANHYGWSSYLGELHGREDVPYHAAPARADDLRGLPRTFLAVGALDIFSDEDIDYAVRLRHAGVPTDLHVYAGAPHGFEGLAPGSTVAKRANTDIEEWLAAQLARPT
jgi:acetyl esterase/lipase